MQCAYMHLIKPKYRNVNRVKHVHFVPVGFNYKKIKFLILYAKYMWSIYIKAKKSIVKNKEATRKIVFVKNLMEFWLKSLFLFYNAWICWQIFDLNSIWYISAFRLILIVFENYPSYINGNDVILINFLTKIKIHEVVLKLIFDDFGRNDG